MTVTGIINLNRLFIFIILWAKWQAGENMAYDIMRPYEYDPEETFDTWVTQKTCITNCIIIYERVDGGQHWGRKGLNLYKVWEQVNGQYKYWEQGKVI